MQIDGIIIRTRLITTINSSLIYYTHDGYGYYLISLWFKK